MVRPPKELIEAAKSYIPVRVTGMRDVDLSTFRFDYDLTFSILLMNADGTIYHRYGTRNHEDAMKWISMKSLVKLLNDSIEDHEAYQKDPKPPKAVPKRTIEDSPSFSREDKKKRRDCVHCHMIHNFDREDRMAAKTWKPDDIWIWPTPDRIGLTLAPEDQSLVEEVERGSPAHKAKLEPGDRLIRSGTQRLRTVADLQAVLHDAEGGKTKLELVYERDGTEMTATLKLKKGWKRGTPLTFSWRSLKWGLKPQPGFGGPQLNADELKKVGLPEDAFAFRVGYIVTWGNDAHTGKNAQKAGIRKGDIVVSVGGKRDFESMHHFQSWYRLTQRIGTRCEVQLIRGGKVQKIALPVIE